MTAFEKILDVLDVLNHFLYCVGNEMLHFALINKKCSEHWNTFIGTHGNKHVEKDVFGEIITLKIDFKTPMMKLKFVPNTNNWKIITTEWTDGNTPIFFEQTGVDIGVIIPAIWKVNKCVIIPKDYYLVGPTVYKSKEKMDLHLFLSDIIRDENGYKDCKYGVDVDVAESNAIEEWIEENIGKKPTAILPKCPILHDYLRN